MSAEGTEDGEVEVDLSHGTFCLLPGRYIHIHAPVSPEHPLLIIDRGSARLQDDYLSVLSPVMVDISLKWLSAGNYVPCIMRNLLSHAGKEKVPEVLPSGNLSGFKAQDGGDRLAAVLVHPGLVDLPDPLPCMGCHLVEACLTLCEFFQVPGPLGHVTGNTANPGHLPVRIPEQE